MSQHERPESELWIRYLDWSAARILRRLTEMSPDEVWQCAHRSTSDSLDLPPLPRGHTGPSSNNLRIVRQATLVIAGDLELPAFAEWKQLYDRSPAEYDREMLGIDPFEAIRETD